MRSRQYRIPLKSLDWTITFNVYADRSCSMLVPNKQGDEVEYIRARKNVSDTLRLARRFSYAISKIDL